MGIDFSEETLKKQIEDKSAEAVELVNDTDKLERFLQRLERKLNKVPGIGKALADIMMLISLVRAYAKKEYTDVPIGTIIAIVGALIYFVSPIDLIPDNVPVIGYLDDLAVINFALKLVHDDIEEYKEWKENSGK